MNANRRSVGMRGIGAALLTVAFGAGLFAAGEDLAVMEIELPEPIFLGTPVDIEITEHMEPYTEELRGPYLAPRGTILVSRGKPVTVSDPDPIGGSAERVTDGNKEAGDEFMLEMHRRTQWVQVDLGREYEIQAVVLWHAHDAQRIVRDVIVQMAADPAFTKGVTTLYNNDYDNSSGLGVGKDKEYFEKHEGRLIEGRGMKGRYVRCHSRGSTYSALNYFTEVEVYGRR